MDHDRSCAPFFMIVPSGNDRESQGKGAALAKNAGTAQGSIVLFCNGFGDGKSQTTAGRRAGGP